MNSFLVLNGGAQLLDPNILIHLTWYLPLLWAFLMSLPPPVSISKGGGTCG